MQRIEGFGLARVIDSDDDNYKTGDIIGGIIGWEEYSLLRSSDNLQLRKIQLDDDIPLSYHLGLLGMTRLLLSIIGRNQSFVLSKQSEFTVLQGWLDLQHMQGLMRYVVLRKEKVFLYLQHLEQLDNLLVS